MRCHEVDFEITGHDTQVVIVELDPQETVIAEAGAMLYMEEGIKFEAKLGDGSDPEQGFFGKMWSAGKRAITRESLFMTHFTHEGSGKSHVAFTGQFPGQIVPIDMSNLKGDLICQKDSFLAAALGTSIGVEFRAKLGAGFFGGEGFVMQRLNGDGMAFVHAGGTLIERKLNGDTLRVDTGCVVAFEEDLSYDIQRAGNLKSMFLGGEGLFLATLQGQGRVWLQSSPFSKIADQILAHAPSNATGGNKSQGQGSLLGTIADMVDGR